MTLVELIIITAFLSWLVATYVAAINKQETVSNTLKRWGTQANSFAFFFGVLLGHWFFPLKQFGIPTFTIWPLVLIPIALIAGLDVFNAYNKNVLPTWLRYPGLWVLLGIPTGAFFWASWW